MRPYTITHVQAPPDSPAERIEKARAFCLGLVRTWPRGLGHPVEITYYEDGAPNAAGIVVTLEEGEEPEPEAPPARWGYRDADLDVDTDDEDEDEDDHDDPR